MPNRIFNHIFPIGGGTLGGVSPIIIQSSALTWPHISNLVLEGVILAVIGGVLGWSVKHLLDAMWLKYKNRKRK